VGGSKPIAPDDGSLRALLWTLVSTWLRNYSVAVPNLADRVRGEAGGGRRNAETPRRFFSSRKQGRGLAPRATAERARAPRRSPSRGRGLFGCLARERSASPPRVRRPRDMDINRAVEDLQTSAAGLVSLTSLEGLGYGVGDSRGLAGHGLELGDAAGKRVKAFAAHFSKRLEAAEASVRSSSDALRGDVLNSVIMAEANATSDVPALSRATSAATKNAAEKLKELRANAAAAPALRLEMLEHCAERRLRMERGYLATDAPKEERRAREMRRAIEGKQR
jgi:hypothetical protein